ncbi:Sperm-associated antigen 4 protein [Elasticomyces elasticus]|nr:Sperm-associated antigen 4 protein [Elasticomyces elasticus]
MKIAIAFLSVAAVAAAQPHGHPHHHAEKRSPSPVADIVYVPGPTMVVYMLNGQEITEADVEEGVRNGTLVWAHDSALSVAATSSSTSNVASTSAPSSTTSSAAPSSISSDSSSSSSSTSVYVPPSSSSVAPTSTSEAAASSAAPTISSGSYSHGNHGVDTHFDDGNVDCSTFPSDYGAVAVDWIGLGGWTGIQQPGSNNGGYDNIMTVTKQTCSNGKCCTEGSFCSYACPAGYQKAQWPTTQGATGQSVGGILCQNGKLRLTNPAQKSLCMPGTDKVSVSVKNTMSKNAAVCRTDYPGTEGETIPLDAQPGMTVPLTCPEAANYYTWKGGSTSAQYYVNPAGVSVADACQWGSPGNPWGNYAPMNIGAGYSAGAAWLSIFQNAPTTTAQLDFTVEIVGDNGGYGNLSGRCKYMNGQYCSGNNYENCSLTVGCTVAVTSGSATFVFSAS